MKRPAAAVIAPIVVVAFFAVTQAAVVHSIGKSSASYRSAVGVGDAAGWIDRLVPRGTDIAVLLGSPAGPDADRDYLWQTQFFNRAPLAAASWGKELLTDPLTGAVTSPTGSPVPLPPFVVTPASQRLQGDVVAANGAFLLIRPANPAALAALATGFLGDGWIAPQAAVSWFGNTGTGTVHVHLDRAFVPASIGPATATVTVGPLVAAADGSPSVPPGSPTQTAQISTTQAADLAFDAPKAPFRVTITIDPGYRPSDVGQADTRELGARASVAIDDQVIAQ